MEIIEVHDNYSALGINSRRTTQGEEAEMVDEFINFRKELFRASSQNQLAIFIETKINDTYPDIIFTEYNPSYYEQWNDNRNKLSTSDLKILYYIYSQNYVSSQWLIKELSIQYKTLLSSLEALIDAQLIDRIDGYWTVSNKTGIFGVNHIEAVEAKISKWNQVMQQAIINKSFASESFVLSKRKKEPDMEVVERIKAFGIGIYLYDNKQFSCYTHSSYNMFPSNYNSIYLNECIGRIINS